LGRPGIVMMSPVIATINPAPLESFISLTVMTNPCGLPKRVGSSEREYCVLATHMGSLSILSSSIFLIALSAAGKMLTLSAP